MGTAYSTAVRSVYKGRERGGGGGGGGGGEIRSIKG